MCRNQSVNVRKGVKLWLIYVPVFRHEQLPNCSFRYVQSELVHSRFAMAAVAGILIPEVWPKLLSNSETD